MVPASRQVFGEARTQWLAPLWRALAEAAARLEFRAGDESAHAAAFSLRAGDRRLAAERTGAIASWRRQSAPLAWMAKAVCRDPERGLAAAWPLPAELAWIAPGRFSALAGRLDDTPLSTLKPRFDRDFEGSGEIDDNAWFPAWACIAHAALAEGVRRTERQNDSAAERGARRAAEILSFERQGRHPETVAARRKLRHLHPGLFAYLMQTR